MAAVLKELAEKSRYRTEAIRYHKDGTPVYVDSLTIALRGEEGQITGYVGIHRDITGRKRAEEGLRESEECFRATFEQAAVGMAHNALDGRWLRVNQKLCDILGYTREELLEKTFQEITHPDDLEANLSYNHQLLSGEIDSVESKH